MTEPDDAQSAPDPVPPVHEAAEVVGSDVASTPAAITAVDVDGVGAVTVGTIAWTVALVLCLVLHTSLADAGRGWWVWVCVCGAVLGVAGLWFVRRRRDAYAAAAAR
jgi:hypothetical protein